MAEWRLALITGPTSEPISSAEAKVHLRVTHTNDDTYIATLITAARRFAEESTNRRFVNQTWDMFTESGFPREIVVPYPPLVSVTSIKYYDCSNTERTLGTSYYEVVSACEPGRIKEAYGYSWPNTLGGRYQNVTVRFLCGYGTATNAVPSDIQHAMKLLVGRWYEHREEISDGKTLSRVPVAAESLLRMHWVPEFA